MIEREVITLVMVLSSADEVIPAGTRSRKVKTKAEKKVVKPPPPKRRKLLPQGNKKGIKKEEPEEFEVRSFRGSVAWVW